MRSAAAQIGGAYLYRSRAARTRISLRAGIHLLCQGRRETPFESLRHQLQRSPYLHTGCQKRVPKIRPGTLRSGEVTRKGLWESAITLFGRGATHSSICRCVLMHIHCAPGGGSCQQKA